MSEENMSPTIDTEILALFSKLKLRQSVKGARQQLDDIYPRIHAAGDAETQALRMSRGNYKRLLDEVRPALIYAMNQIPDGDIQFHLSDGATDATAWPDADSPGIPIEVTIALGKVRHRQMQELNEKGMSHGFTNATDADSRETIQEKYDDYRGYSPEEAASNLKKGIDHCVSNKAHLDSALIVAVPFESLLPTDWPPLIPGIAKGLPASKCRAIYIVGKSLKEELCFQLK